MERRPDTGLLASLWQFPNRPGLFTVPEALTAAEQMGVQPVQLLKQVRRKHIFTHITWEMTGIHMEVRSPAPGFVWMTGDQIRTDAAIPTAFRQFLTADEIPPEIP